MKKHDSDLKSDAKGHSNFEENRNSIKLDFIEISWVLPSRVDVIMVLIVQFHPTA
jgi:hypothetical protein